MTGPPRSRGVVGVGRVRVTRGAHGGPTDSENAEYFICVWRYLENCPSLVPASLFAVIHIATTATNYL